MEAPELRAEVDSTSSVTHSGHIGAFKASGNPSHYSDTTTTHSSIMNNHPSRTGYYDNETGLNAGRNTTGYYDNSTTSGTLGSIGNRSGTYDSTQTVDGLEARRTPSSIVAEQTSRHGWGIDLMDHKLMNSVQSDIHAMHSTDPEEFEGVASKIDETFGVNAL